MTLEFNDLATLKNVGQESQLGNSPVVTIVGMKRTTSNFLPVSHEGEGNETYVDKIDGLLGANDGIRAEFIARKQEGIERRGHMNLLRSKMVEKIDGEIDIKEKWEDLFDNKCIIPHTLCISCPNCSLFGGWNSDNDKKTFSRVRNFDTYSIQTDDCIVNDESVAGMKIGNQVAEDSKKATASNFHYYESVKPGVYFPFIVMIERATLFDVASYLKAIRWADNHGYGKYSARNGKFQTDIWAVANGHPKFSILDILEAANEVEEIEFNNFKELLSFEEEVIYKDTEGNGDKIDTIEKIEEQFDEEFEKYFELIE